MAAKKGSRKKKVTITIDADVLLKLQDAAQVLSELCAACATAVDDPKLRREILKKAKRRPKKRG